ncbi:MAG: acetyl-CoA synthetase [Lachnospiraceae bacterium]|nr:acetyl-CoA synthetase [Lachnospiraceae bacterium]
MGKALNELESGKLLNDYKIPVVASELLTEGSAAAIREAAARTGFPVVMKILSEDILHKTDLGCVKLNIADEEEMRSAYEEIMANAEKGAPKARIQGVLVQQMLPKGFEILLGVSTDPQFGRVIMAGLGGIYVELLQAVSLRILPITRTDALQMIDETPLAKACEGLRGVRYDREEIADALMNLSRLAADHPEIEEIDVNPFVLFGDGRRGTGVDAMVVVRSENT